MNQLERNSSFLVPSEHAELCIPRVIEDTESASKISEFLSRKLWSGPRQNLSFPPSSWLQAFVHKCSQLEKSSDPVHSSNEQWLLTCWMSGTLLSPRANAVNEKNMLPSCPELIHNRWDRYWWSSLSVMGGEEQNFKGVFGASRTAGSTPMLP